MVYTCKYKSLIGDILLAADEIGLTGLWFEGQKYFANTLPKDHIQQETEILTEAKKWLDVYFFGEEPNIQKGSVADFTGDSLRTDDHIWRNCAQNCSDEKHFPYVRPGSRRCGWT